MDTPTRREFMNTVKLAVRDIDVPRSEFFPKWLSRYDPSPWATLYKVYGDSVKKIQKTTAIGHSTVLYNRRD